MGGQAYPVSLPASACDQDTSKHATIMRKELHVPIFPVPSFAADAFSERIGDATLTGADCRLQTPGEFCKMDGLDSATGKLRLDWNETWHDKTEELKALKASEVLWDVHSFRTSKVWWWICREAFRSTETQSIHALEYSFIMAPSLTFAAWFGDHTVQCHKTSSWCPYLAVVLLNSNGATGHIAACAETQTRKTITEVRTKQDAAHHYTAL